MVVHNKTLCLQVFVSVFECVDWVSIVLEDLLVFTIIFLLVVDLDLLLSSIVASNKEALLILVLLLNLLSHLVHSTHALTQGFANLTRCLCLLRNEHVADLLINCHL